ncbi:MAG: chemotaxis protein CheW, partial [Proteocatella sp.]
LLASSDVLKEMVYNVSNSDNVDISEIKTELMHVLEKASNSKGKGDDADSPKLLAIKKRSSFNIDGLNYSLLKDNIRYGHFVYEISLNMNGDLLDYEEGPIKLFNAIQSIGMLVDMKMDYSKINSLEDVLKALDDESFDVKLDILITTVLDKKLLASTLDIIEENIIELTEADEKQDVKKHIKDDRLESKKEIYKEQPKENVEKNLEAKSAVKKRETPKKEPTQNISEEKTVFSNVSDETIRVHLSVLNDLLNMASEMVLARNQLLSTLENHKKNIGGLSSILQNVDYLTSSMQEKIMQTRMQPVGNIFNKFPRVIRDISRNLSKEIELIIEGADVELDKSIIEGLGDPLTHLIRNSADHGLELPDEREANGKARTGIIKLRAYHECGAVNIDIIDDGKGMDAEKIKNSALEKGVLTKAELDVMSEQEIIKLIFRPGFSTAKKLTDVSGRGVGMDVVKTNIEKLGGSVEIFTVIGEGTTVRLILPLTLAIVQSLVVATCGHRFIIPQVDVQEIVRIKDDESKKIEFVQNAEVFRLRGKLIPIVHLSKVLNIDKEENQENGIRVLIIRQGKRLFGLAVEDVLGSEETLVKPVPPYLKDCMAYSGVTILGDGKTAMIIDAEGIVKISDLRFLDNNDAFSDNQANQSNLNETQNLLLFKCSGSELYALDIAMVSRIEKIKISDIETIGNKMYVNHRGNSLRIIRPEDYLEVTGGALSGEFAYIIIPKLVKHPMGILTSAIHDNIKVSLKLDNQEIKMNGLIGSSIYRDKIMLIINIYELFEMADPERNETIQYDYRKGKSVLIVEDTPFFQQMTQNYLLGAGYEVYLANNGREALDLLSHSMVDVVISDVQMPVMDGYEFVKRMKESTALSHIPVIAVTSMTGEYNKNIGLEKGFDYYEYKLDRDRLLKVIDIAIGG